MDWKNELERTQTEQPAGSVNWDEELQGRRRGGVSGSFAPLPWGQALLEGFSNFPSSFVENIKSLIQPLLHPIETAKGLGTLGAGIVEKTVIPGQQKHEPSVDILLEHLEGRYGSVENLKKTIAKDPVGVLVDIGSVVYPAGKAVQITGKAAQLPSVARAGATIAKAGLAAEPINIAARTAAAPLRIGLKVFKQVPSKLYQSAVKFSTSLKPAERAKLTLTGLEEWITPTRKGILKAEKIINELNSEITSGIDAAARTGHKIPVTDLFKNYGHLYAEASLTGKPLQARKILDRIRRDILKENERLGRAALTPIEAQKLKQSIYRDLETYYSSLREAPIAVKAQKSIAKAAKESLEELIPEIKQLNAREGALIELKEALERSAGRIQNRDLIGIGGPIKVGAGGVAASGAGVTAGLLMALLEWPRTKTALAKVLHTLQQRGIKVRETPIAVRLGLYQAGRVKEVVTKDPNQMTQAQYETWRRSGGGK